jgi:hypothetical protein
MSSARTRAAFLFALLLLVALALTAVPAAPSRARVSGSVAAAVPASVTATTTAATPDPAHPYSDPVWFPLRNPAKVGCVYSNCPGPYHGYWAILFGGNADDPIYAAGGGVFHIGKLSPGCPASGVTAGTWVWIDHGPAGATVYEHLNHVLATEGQLVTPGTEIATMGHSGETYPCHTYYVHVEWQAQRLGGTKLPIPSMFACVGSTPKSYPAALGYSSWNSIPNMQVSTGTLTSSCMPNSWSTPSRPTFALARGYRAAYVSPSARPTGTERWRDRVEEYHPSLHAYGLPTYHDHYPTTSTTTLTGLTNGHTYRISVAFHNASGWSAWATTQTVIPSAVPPAPVFRSLSSSSASIYYSWYRSTSYGLATATYQVARRCRSQTGSYVAWVFNTVPGTNTSFTWRPVTTGNICEVTVRGHNSAGYGYWGTRHFVLTQ